MNLKSNLRNRMLFNDSPQLMSDTKQRKTTGHFIYRPSKAG